MLDGVQTYQCTVCTKRFRNKRKEHTKEEESVWHDYVFKKQVLRELIEDYHRDIRTLHQYLINHVVPAKEHTPRALFVVVDALYFRMTGLPRPRWNAQLHAAAGAVADGLLSAYQRGTAGIPAVSAAAWASLKLQISLHPVYLSGPAGIVPSLLGTGEYPHNGA